jgi:hypothetical protein
MNMRKSILFVVGIFLVVNSFSQSTPKIPLMREIFHVKIDKAQKSIESIYARDSSHLKTEAKLQFSHTLYNTVDSLQTNVELDSTISENDKIKLLRGMNDVLSFFARSLETGRIPAEKLSTLVDAYLTATSLDQKGTPITSIIEANDLAVGEILIRCFPFDKSEHLAEYKQILEIKPVYKDASLILNTLIKNPDISIADSLISVLARRQQEDIYSWAQSTNSPLGQKIQQSEDTLVKIIVHLAGMNEGRLYFPFLDNLYKGKITMDEIRESTGEGNELKYYKLLVRTEIDYAKQLQQKDTPMAMSALATMLKRKALDNFINVINGLHDSPDNIRMKVVEPLTAQELYYLCVVGETEIYTSSYLKTYERIFQRMKNPRSDSLLISVGYDHFKKFIKMAANYNTLNDFLKRMDKGNAETLMKDFVNGLEKTETLEDAVDVADSYASISDNKLRSLILSVVKKNLADTVVQANKRANTIYDLLNTIFLSIDPSNNIDISSKFGIPPIYTVNIGSLRNSAGQIIIQQFFYGDKDGNTVFNYFINAYSRPGWKIVRKPEWIEVSSTKGVPVIIYANKPLDATKELDAQAQADLADYLDSKELSPTVVIHRGHSYHVSSTIQQIQPSTKVVLLGSCGGYHNINGVLKVCPYAHIIATKQVGSGTINQPMIIYITDLLQQGKNLNWPQIWKEFSNRFKSNNMFDDYVPPHKNLGAIFIMTYNKMMESRG